MAGRGYHGYCRAASSSARSRSRRARSAKRADCGFILSCNTILNTGFHCALVALLSFALPSLMRIIRNPELTHLQTTVGKISTVVALAGNELKAAECGICRLNHQSNQICPGKCQRVSASDPTKERKLCRDDSGRPMGECALYSTSLTGKDRTQGIRQFYPEHSTLYKVEVEESPSYVVDDYLHKDAFDADNNMSKEIFQIPLNNDDAVFGDASNQIPSHDVMMKETDNQVDDLPNASPKQFNDAKPVPPKCVKKTSNNFRDRT